MGKEFQGVSLTRELWWSNNDWERGGGKKAGHMKTRLPKRKNPILSWGGNWLLYVCLCAAFSVPLRGRGSELGRDGGKAVSQCTARGGRGVGV